MSTLQDIAAIAKKALEESNTVTESDVAPILSDALEAIIELCQMEQQDREAIFGNLKIVVEGIEQITSGIEVGFSFSKEGVIIHRKNTLEVLCFMAQAMENVTNLVDRESRKAKPCE